jgi:hypothetical protein
MRLLVCGGRTYSDKDYLFSTLDTYRPHVVIQGGASGADALAKEWASYRNIPCEEFKADWACHGKAAGPMRNKKMLDEGKPDIVLAFDGGKGTENMKNLAVSYGIRVVLA